MTKNRKELKKELDKLKTFRSHLPRLIDCSEVHGDNFYSKSDILTIDLEIETLEFKLKDIDSELERIKTIMTLALNKMLKGETLKLSEIGKTELKKCDIDGKIGTWRIHSINCNDTLDIISNNQTFQRNIPLNYFKWSK